MDVEGNENENRPLITTEGLVRYTRALIRFLLRVGKGIATMIKLLVIISIKITIMLVGVTITLVLLMATVLTIV